MKLAKVFPALPILVLVLEIPLHGQQQARVETFSPQGLAKKIRQARARFSEAMVPLGDPRVTASPFEILCPQKGTERWADGRNWMYDFDSDLPAGVRCEFKLRDGVKTLAGNEITGQRTFTFSTGGPSILSSQPYQGSEYIDEEQVFVLQLDGEATEASVLSSVWFKVEGIAERIGILILAGKERETILKTIYRYRREPKEILILIQAKRRFPAGTKVSLVWGKGVAASSGTATDKDQILPFKTRLPFTATFECQRENAQSDCVPVTPMRVRFSAPISASEARKALLKGPNGRQWRPSLNTQGSGDGEESETGEEPANGELAYNITFKGPFPEKASFAIELPPGLKDDAGRMLANASSFPLTVRTDEYPPLAKFAADFGILELKANPMLPVTLRNVEPEVSARMLHVIGGEGSVEPEKEIPKEPLLAGNMEGKMLKLPSEKANQMIFWIRKIAQRGYDDRDKSVFGKITEAKARTFSIPKLRGKKAFEVIGIPIKTPGFYIVEIKSEILGAALLGAPKPMYVATAVLVTNLAVHFKWGNESSLAWVTTLNAAKPVNQATVQVRNCSGDLLWDGKTDRNGIARIDKLPQRQSLPQCYEAYDPLSGGLVVSAQLADDMAFVHTSWDEGIEPWRFHLPIDYDYERIAAHTIFDRTLLRSGETVHMKHILRNRAVAGFTPLQESERPKRVEIVHTGSQQTYDLPVKWDAAGMAETSWQIPKDARLGTYSVSLASGEEGSFSGSFRVEEFRVPLMRGLIRPPSEPQVSPASITMDLSVSFLAGGAAPNLPVKFRYQLQPRYYSPITGFDDFIFANGRVREGLVRGEPQEAESTFELKSTPLTLDKAGSARTSVTGLPKVEKPMDLLSELEYRDPNGEVQTVSSKLPLWPAARLVGIKTDSWTLSKDMLKFQVAVADVTGKPVADAPVKVDLLKRNIYSHRKRLVGGFYAYEHSTETKKVQVLCQGKTDRRGLLICETPSPASGNLILQAATTDASGNESAANMGIWVAGKEDLWFRAEDGDRMDVIPEVKRYEPGDKARFQVRMPFRKATALITTEREGVGEAFVRELSGKEPMVEIPVKGNYAPNMFVSVLVVRGRVAGAQPTALVDLGKPAYKIGIAEIQVGWKAYELKVSVSADRPVYKVREKANVNINVATPEGKAPPTGSEIAIAAVDEGLLELAPNESWKLLDAMMGKRSYGVQMATAQMHVIGKRHFGLKALPQGGGGGRELTRELFDTLLLWKGRVPLDAKGQASVEVPLNDSITSFRIVAIATGGLDKFGTGSTSIRATQDLIIFSGIAPVVRERDAYRPEFTLRNATERALDVQVAVRIKEMPDVLAPMSISLAPGESKEIGWNISIPAGVESLKYEMEANAGASIKDRISVVQKVAPAVPARIFQATLFQLEKDYQTVVERPKDALPGSGGIQVLFRPSLLDGLSGVKDYMAWYPYSCLEQAVSKAIALRNDEQWKKIMNVLPSYLDGDGLAKYFASMPLGSDVLTSYLLAIAHEAGWTIPQEQKQHMMNGLRAFVEGKVIRHSSLPTADLSIRKIAAVEALSRLEKVNPNLLSSIAIEPNLWPTSAVIDWINILQRVPGIRNRDQQLAEADQNLRTRLNFQGTTMGFSTERTDYLWWLMVSTDSNAVRMLLSRMESTAWKEDVPRLVRGALGRLIRGHWSTTTANAWGILTMEKFARNFEKTPVTGKSTANLNGKAQALDWNASPKGKALSFGWPVKQSALGISMAGTGSPWTTVQSIAAIPLKQPLSSGYKIRKTYAPLEQRERGVWSKGDIVRVRLELEAQSDMTWVVLSDPIPAGAAIFGTGLGRDSMLATKGQEHKGWVWPAFEERSFEAYRVYYEYVPKGMWTIEYTMRLNAQGLFNLPTTRIEAMYSPEMFGEIPNEPVRIR